VKIRPNFIKLGRLFSSIARFDHSYNHYFQNLLGKLTAPQAHKTALSTLIHYLKSRESLINYKLMYKFALLLEKGHQ